MSYFNVLCNEFEELGQTPIVLEEFFCDGEAYKRFFDEKYQSIKQDYDNKFNKVTLSFEGKKFNMMTNTLLVHMVLWKPFLHFNNPFSERFIIETKKINADMISEYLDMVIEEFITYENQMELNIVISEIREELSWFSLDFNPIVGNTINLYDKIQLAKRNERYNDIIHTSLDDESMTMVEIEEEMKVRTNDLMNILKTEDNCFRDYIGSGEGVNRDQLTQFEVIIGPKPTMSGAVFPKIVNTNFLVNGLQSPSDYLIDASGGRKASVINFTQVKDSGYMTRKLSLLCMNTLLNPENNDCGSTNYMKLNIDCKKTLGRLNGRYAIIDGKEVLIKKTNKDLIGKEILLRSPITCCSHDGKVCRKCYGELAKINDNIHIGVLGTQFLTEQQTQKMLSAKHLLKTNSETINWQPEFLEFFNVSSNSIGMNLSLSNPSLYTLVFNENDMNESGDSEYSNSITKFIIKSKGVKDIFIESEKELFISDYLEKVLDFNGIKDDDGNISLSMDKLSDDETFFFIEIENNELSKHLHSIINLIDKKDHLGATNKDELMQMFLELVNEAGIHIDSVHLENIVREILRNPNNLTKRPDWSQPNPAYDMLRVSDAIMNSDSISTSLSFEKIKKQLYEPETYEKVAESLLDSLFE